MGYYTKYYWHGRRPYVANWKGYAYPSARGAVEVSGDDAQRSPSPMSNYIYGGYAQTGQIVPLPEPPLGADALSLEVPTWMLAAGGFAAWWFYFRKPKRSNPKRRRRR
jgi:hypothetical protein